MKILSIIGTRPEAIKMAPIVKEFLNHQDRIRSLVCVTGQHRQMLDQVLSIFNIQPDYDLDVMVEDQALSDLTGALFNKLDIVVKKTDPDWILAQGDTTTVLVSSLVAFYNKKAFGHVEAGLRTGDLREPFPEEMNRRIADSIADLLFAPTERNRKVLLDEGISDNKIFVTGNTVVDALNSAVALPYNWSSGPLRNISQNRRIVLITAHRRESFGNPIREICKAVKELARIFYSEGVDFVYPVHLNPNVRQPAEEILSNIKNISLVDPLDYLSLVNIMKRATLILTDSGGIQEEAPSFGVPVLVMRNMTERQEGVEAGVVKVVGKDRKSIVDSASRLLNDPLVHSEMVKGFNPYGDGYASERIVNALLKKGSK